jgi:hypothetical protein
MLLLVNFFHGCQTLKEILSYLIANSIEKPKITFLKKFFVDLPNQMTPFGVTHGAFWRHSWRLLASL